MIKTLTAAPGIRMQKRYFVDYQDTLPTILFKLTYFMAGSPRVVDYATLHGRTPYFEDTESLANDFNFSASWEVTQAT